MGCGCSRQLKDVRLSGTPLAKGNSREFDHATPSIERSSGSEERIERSKAHWSTLSEHSGYTDAELMDFQVSNLLEFLALQEHPTWGSFFGDFTGDGMSMGFDSDVCGELVLRKKFAEGAQAELYEVEIKWKEPINTEIDKRFHCEYVLKVFKEMVLFKDLKSQFPQGFLQFCIERDENFLSPTPKELPQYLCEIYFGILLKGGRFGFLMQKQHFDLGTLIERNMELRSGEDSGPFSEEEGKLLMYQVALGVERLHNHGIVHRDLKASNVLVYEYESGCPRWECFVADYECSIGVVGTDFFGEPEILQACKDRNVNEKPEVFSRAADIYSYGMICYEILTGKLPFEDHPLRHRPSLLTDLVINQHLRPEVRDYVDDSTRELLDGGWQFDATKRSRIAEVLDLLSANSMEVRRYEDYLKKEFGENYRRCCSLQEIL